MILEFLLDYGLFLAKSLTFVVVLLITIFLIKGMNDKSGDPKGALRITDLTEKHQKTVTELESHLHDPAFLKARQKAEDKEKKTQEKQNEKALKKAAKAGKLEQERDPYLFVLDFKGSIDAKEVASLREEVTAILAVATEKDEVLVRLESGGGMVHGYGLASSQLDRIKNAQIPLAISVDKVAASGGYMMACVADKIIAAPFAIVGSIGVIAQIPNFNKLLKKNDIEFEQMTAGEYKRTLTMFGENTDKAREKFKQELEDTHVLFKNFIADHRPELDLEKVATGEHWFGIQAHELGLVDEIRTSDDVIMEAAQNKTVLAIQYQRKKKLSDKLAGTSAKVMDAILMKFIARGQKPIV